MFFVRLGVGMFFMLISGNGCEILSERRNTGRVVSGSVFNQEVVNEINELYQYCNGSENNGANR